ncbi:ATP synthase subunit I [Fusobacterium hominis]|uniref:ATP synthase subunit I n=1 Tax=Fusobacterium hominis TaxID=2764326 RepID=A0A7G9GV44_9FUSO|nr:ATP synthase subunit I [Fusobacterium hominis]QNM14676.1 ATP synthase subunit I [Fusobacterium hominis]
MEDIKRLFKRAGITALIILIYGVLVQSKEVYLGMFTGALVSILSLYLLCIDVKKIIATKDGSKKRAILGYLQRYVLYIVYLGVMAKFFGLSMVICSGLGLLNVKFNIQLMALSDRVLKFRDKHLK